jgi:hypothetical protein
MNLHTRYLFPLVTTAAVALVAAGCLTGCITQQHVTTLPDGTSVTNVVKKLDPQRTAKAIKAIIPPAVTFAVKQEPSSRVYIAKAQAAICFSAAAGKFSPEELKAAIEATGIKEIQTPEVEAALQAVYGIYDAYYGDVIAQKLNQNEWLIPVLTAMCDGLTDGLTNAPAPAKISIMPIP